MDNERHWFEEYTVLVERNIKGVQVHNGLWRLGGGVF